MAAEANRRAGRLERAQEQAEQALSLDPESGRANVALGNVYRGYAAKAAEEGVEADRYLELSAAAYQAASAAAERGDDREAQKLRGVAETNLAETYTEMARRALTKGQTAEADRQQAPGRGRRCEFPVVFCPALYRGAAEVLDSGDLLDRGPEPWR